MAVESSHSESLLAMSHRQINARLNSDNYLHYNAGGLWRICAEDDKLENSLHTDTIDRVDLHTANKSDCLDLKISKRTVEN